MYFDQLSLIINADLTRVADHGDQLTDILFRHRVVLALEAYVAIETHHPFVVVFDFIRADGEWFQRRTLLLFKAIDGTLSGCPMTPRVGDHELLVEICLNRCDIVAVAGIGFQQTAHVGDGRSTLPFFSGSRGGRHSMMLP